mmetsp:Transcript_73102/g.227248  ORF Transcript_73102/g.227248 Transcript_73102/m.227248 type:complete len:243 (+) Transcript_73102:309-1037(+)
MLRHDAIHLLQQLQPPAAAALLGVFLLQPRRGRVRTVCRAAASAGHRLAGLRKVVRFSCVCREAGGAGRAAAARLPRGLHALALRRQREVPAPGRSGGLPSGAPGACGAAGLWQLRLRDPRALLHHGPEPGVEGCVQGAGRAEAAQAHAAEREGGAAEVPEPLRRTARGHLQQGGAPLLPHGGRAGRGPLHHLRPPLPLQRRPLRPLLHRLHRERAGAPARAGRHLPRPEARERRRGRSRLR